MKKILSLLALVLLGCMGAWAQELPVTISPSLENPTWYSIEMTSSQTCRWKCSSTDDTFLGKENVGNIKLGYDNWENYAFCFIAVGDNYKIYSKKAEKYIQVTAVTDHAKVMLDDEGSLVNFVKDNNKWYIYDVTVTNDAENTKNELCSYSQGDNYVSISNSSRGRYSGAVPTFVELTDEIQNRLEVTYNVTATDPAGNNQIQFACKQFAASNQFPAPTLDYFDNIQVTDAAKVDADHTTFTVTATYNYPMMPGKFYYLKADSRHGTKYVNYVSDTEANNTADKVANDPTFLWYVVSKGDNTFWLCNVEKEKAVVGTTSNNDASVTFADASGSTVAYEVVKTDASKFRLYWPNSNENLGAHGMSSGTSNAALGKWGSGRAAGNGTNFSVEEFDESIFNVSNGMGEGYVGSISNYADFAAAKDAYTASKTAANLKATIEAYANLDKRVALRENKFYYFRNVGSIAETASGNKHPYSWLTSTLSSADRMTMDHNAEPGKSAIFFYNGTNLIAYDGGLYANANSTSLNAYEWTLEEFSNNAYCLKNGSDYLTYWGWESSNSSNTSNYDALMKTTREDWAAWYLKEVTELPLTMVNADGAYYASLLCPVAVALPAGVKAYSAMIEGGAIVLTKVVESDVLAAWNPVILYSDTEVTAPLTISNEPGTGAVNNDLSGTVNAISATEGIGAGAYVLNHKNHANIGFYKTNSKVNGFKAYFTATDVPSSSNALSFRFEDVITAIDAVEKNNAKSEIFDINGRRQSKAQQGINIINGMKVLVK